MVDSPSLPSWNDGAAKSAIHDLVARVTKQGGGEFVPPAARVATFDNDGTLWCEQPLQIQFFFAFERVKQLSAKDPTMSERQPFKAVLEHDYNTLFGLGKQALCAYRPQLELLAYLRENGFKTYIVSAGGVDFMRAFAEEAYGIPREQVIGSSVKLRYDLIDNRVSLVKLPELNSFGDREMKTLNIGLHIGRRPLLAFGNSDGDLAMMRYAKSGSGPRLSLFLHHDDAAREAAYDREFRLSPLSEALDKAGDYGITVVSMKRDWKVVF